MDITIKEVGLIERTASLLHGFPAVYIRAYILATATELGKSLTEEFVIGRWVTGSQVVTDSRGWFKTTTGIFIDPATLDPSKPEPAWAYEAVTQDLKAEMLNLLKSTFRSQLDSGLTGDHTGDATKPLYWSGVLVRQNRSTVIQRGGNLGLTADVRQLVGTVVKA